MKLSIIIPVYNVEKYIRGTLDSIYSQNYDETQFEVIIVNDGTPDNSMAIVGEYTTHVNLIIINKENGGLSSARNAGLAIAKGDYIWFVDSDDKVEKGCISIVIEDINDNKCDVYGFNVVKVKESDGTEILESPIVKLCNLNLNKSTYKTLSLTGKMHIGLVQRYIFSNHYLSKKQIRFKEGIVFEDDEFMVRLMALNCNITFNNKVIYRYLIRESGSIMSTFKMKNISDTMHIIDGWKYLFYSSNGRLERAHYSFYIVEKLIAILSQNSDNAEYFKFIEQNKKHLKMDILRFYFSWCFFKPLGQIRRVIQSMFL